MDKKIIKGLGIGAMCLAGAVGLTGCNTNVDETDEQVKIVSIDVLEETIPESLEAGDFDEGNIVLLVKYSDDSEKKIHLTEEYVQSAYKNKLLQTGEHTIWIDYNGFTDTLNINVTMTETSIAEKFQNAVKYAVEHDSVMTYKDSYYDSGEQQEENQTMYHHYNTESEEVEMFFEYEYENAAGTKEKQCSFSNATEGITWANGYCEYSLNSYFSNKSDANYSYTFIDGDIANIAKSGVGLFTAQYSGEIQKGQLVYTATFTKTEDDETIECVFTFTQDKLLTVKSSMTYTHDMATRTGVTELEYKYQALTDAQMHRTDAMSKKATLTAKITELNTLTTQLKGKAFSLSMRDEDEDETVTYTHEANSDVLTSSSGNLNFADLFSTVTTYGEVSYASADGELSVVYDENGEIDFTIKNGQITNVDTYNYKALGTKHITITYAE